MDYIKTRDSGNGTQNMYVKTTYAIKHVRRAIPSDLLIDAIFFSPLKYAIPDHKSKILANQKPNT
jgi:hypothetical protein